MRRFVTAVITTALSIGVVACGNDSGNTFSDSIGIDAHHAGDSIGVGDWFSTDADDTGEHPVVCCFADSDCHWNSRCVLPDGGGPAPRFPSSNRSARAHAPPAV